MSLYKFFALSSLAEDFGVFYPPPPPTHRVWHIPGWHRTYYGAKENFELLPFLFYLPIAGITGVGVKYVRWQDRAFLASW